MLVLGRAGLTRYLYSDARQVTRVSYVSLTKYLIGNQALNSQSQPS